MSDNIKVVVKVRPLISREIEDKLSYQWRVKNNTLYQIDNNGRDFGASFTFDKVYDKDTKTSDIYNDIAKPIVEAATAGFNGTIFAYGQTSSGKTYTMTGTEDSPGIIPLAVFNLFDIIKNIPDRDFLVRVSYIEIYNETLKDLLNVEKKNIKVHENFQGIKVDCTEQVTTSPDEVLRYLKEGEANRQTGATNMNEESSRSHSIFQITIESREHIEGEEEAGCVNVSTLNLVDLAGSERAGQTGATGIRFKEGTHINKSLSVLALVIKQLSEDQTRHVNYRDSKLTRILQNSLGGNAKTSIICAITPAAIEETISTLQFANRAKAIKNKPEVNAVATDATMIQSLTKQLSKLQSQLESKKNLEVMLESKKNVEQDNFNLQKQIAALQRLILNGFGTRSSVDMLGSRRKLVPPRRITISTLHSIAEDPVPILPKYQTPLLKYNPMSLPGTTDFVPIQSSSKLSCVSEEKHNRLITPPPRDKKVNFNDEIIELDSDDEVSSLDPQTCSPYHKCYGSSKTPPCILRKNAKLAEKNLKDIVELTEREKIYTPSVIELIEKLEQNASVITGLQDKVSELNKKGKDKDLEIDQLRVKVSKSDEEIKTVNSAKSELEVLCKEYTIKLTDWEVSYETLKNKTKRREQELLSLLEEQKVLTANKVHDLSRPIPTFDRELHFVDSSKDISLVNSDNESSIVNLKLKDDQSCSQFQDLVTDMQNQLKAKNETILELETELQTQKQVIASLENSSHQLQSTIENFKEKFALLENENSLLKSTLDTLNSTIQNQKTNLESAHNDIEFYNSLIQELQTKLTNKEKNSNLNINEATIDNMIANEEKFIANNDNIKNIIHCFKLTLDCRNKEIESLKSTVTNCSVDTDLKEQICIKDKEINVLNDRLTSLQFQINDNLFLIEKLIQEKNNLNNMEQQFINKISDIKAQNDKLEQTNSEYKVTLKALEESNIKLTEVVVEKEALQAEMEKKQEEFVEKLNQLHHQNDNNITLIEKLIQDKNNLINGEQQLIAKMSNVSEENDKLKQLNCENIVILDNLKKCNKQLTNKITEKEITEEELTTKYQELNEIISAYEQKIRNFEKDICAKDVIINSFNKENERTQTNIQKAKALSQLIQNCLVKFGGEIVDYAEDVEDVFSVLEHKFSAFECKVRDAFSLKELAIENYNKFIENLENVKQELTAEVNDLRSKLIQASEDLDLKKHLIEQITKKHSETKLQLEIKNTEVEKLTSIVNAIKKENEKLSCDIRDKQILEESTEKNNKEFENQVKTLTLVLQSKDKIINEKDEIIDGLSQNVEKLQNDLKLKVVEVEVASKKIQENLDCESLRLNCILEQISKFIKSLSIEIHFTGDCANTLYENILNGLKYINSYVEELKCEKKSEDNLHEVLLETKKEIEHLTKHNIVNLEKLSDSESRYNLLLHELDEIKSQNKCLNEDLTEGSKTLELLKNELKEKTTDFEILVTKTQDLKDHFIGLDGVMQNQIEELLTDNHNLKMRCTELETTSNEEAKEDFYGVDSRTVILSHCDTVSQINITENKSPPSLLTICCNKIIDAIQPSENSTSTTNSEMTIPYKEIETRSCHCDALKCAQKELKRATEMVQQQEFRIQDLIAEREKIHQEVQLLLEPAYELQKKINSHKTNLSTLTATTYAENKLLKSQVTVLQHHHSRYHHVCQRDLPVLKKQLCELMTLLKSNNSYLDKHNASFKRYSLPSVFDNNSALTDLKNESTLDGDLLMLDTNMSLATSTDNTLMGIDQTCLDITHVCSNNDFACQTNLTDTNNDIKHNIEINLTDNVNIVLIDRLSNENRKVMEKLNILEQENEELKNQLQQLKFLSTTSSTPSVQTSPIKMDSTYKECEECKSYTQKLKNMNEKVEILSLELVEINSVKRDIEKKYDNLVLEIPNTEALIRKLNAFEKDCKNKSDEISKLSISITAKNVQLKQLQLENDSLSTQVMENITETDDLAKQVENLKAENAKITEKCLNMANLLEEAKRGENSIKSNCPTCHIKDEEIKTLQNVELHTKLNRSLSDSETSSRHNKICTLQNELHAGRQDCKELTEEVATIKSHLERSNLSISQNIDLDESMGESNIFTFSKHFEAVDSPLSKFNLPNIQKERLLELYGLDKTECINYYVEKTGANKENLNINMKVIDLMKMFYNDLLTKHSNEVENFVNQVKFYEESRKQLEIHVNEISIEYSKVKDILQIKENSIKTVTDTFSQIRQNITLINEELSNSNNSGDQSVKLVNIFKEKLLKNLDSEFDLTSANIFQKIIDVVANKHQNELSNITEQYTKLLKNMDILSTELNNVSDNLFQIKCRLTDKENEYNLLMVQKEKIQEISKAVTLDVIRKEQELSDAILNGYKKLVDHKIIYSNNFDLTLPLINNIGIIFDRIIADYDAISTEQEKESLILELKKSKLDLEESKKDLEIIKVENNKLKEINKTATTTLVDLEDQIQSQKVSVENLNKENKNNIDEIYQITNKLKLTKELLTGKENIIAKVESASGVQITDIINKISSLKQEIDQLKTVNDIIYKEKETCALELEKCRETLKVKNTELDNTTSDILVLRESVKENITVIENLKLEAKSLLQQNLELKGLLEEKCKDCSRLETNIKTHEKTAVIQSRMITRLQKQKGDDDNMINEKNKRIEELTQQYSDLQKECETMKNNIKASREAIENLQNAKDSLELRLSDLETDFVNVQKPRASIDSDTTRRRRQSIHDSKRTFLEEYRDNNKMEAVFDSHSKPQDIFMDVDEDNSDRSTPLMSSRGRDSLLSGHEQGDKDEEPVSRPSSVAAAARRRRQSIHDLHRSGFGQTPSPHENTSGRLNHVTDLKSSDLDNNNVQSEVTQLREQLSSCQQELEDLKERFREVDEECEICSQYLREREELCSQLNKENLMLTKTINELKDKMHRNRSEQEPKRNFVDATVNTDEDWANLHSVVVDRMSYDAEVEKNKRLTKTIEELRYKKQDLKNTLSKMQKALERNAIRDNSKELEATKSELKACKHELKKLREKYEQLDLECTTCSKYLREMEDRCRKLTEAKAALEAKLQDYHDNVGTISQAVRKKRQSLHDQNRCSDPDVTDAATEISDDFLSYQVERDDDSHTKEIKRLKSSIDKLSQQKAALQHQLISATPAPAPNPMYIATGSAIVQNQQITDVMQENHKLKKLNAKLIQICKKRGKKPDNENQENSEQA